MPDKCYCGESAERIVTPSQEDGHVNCARAYVEGLRKALSLTQRTKPTMHDDFDAAAIRAEIAEAEGGSRS